ncbi:hypothetical protein ACS0TY_000837 [Phlomoides rotata]
MLPFSVLMYAEPPWFSQQSPTKFFHNRGRLIENGNRLLISVCPSSYSIQIHVIVLQELYSFLFLPFDILIINKEEGYFKAAELLERMCKCEIGALTVRKSPALLKRLNNLAEDLSRKA